MTQISFTSEPYRGTFEATKGAEVLGCKRGSFVDTPAGTTVFKELTCESGARLGTFTAKFNPDAPGPADRNGQWSIVEAADGFSGLDGGGEFSAMVDEGWRTGVETLTGDIQFSSEAVKADPAPPLAPTRKARLATEEKGTDLFIESPFGITISPRRSEPASSGSDVWGTERAP